jgi:hypothetical protein
VLSVFEVHLTPGADGSGILSEEIQRETMAQMMTVEDAAAVGFSGRLPEGSNVRLIAVAPRDARWIEQALERAPTVTSFAKHDVPT